MKWSYRILLTAAALLMPFGAGAGGRGGHNTTFDANLWGGPSNVACLCSGAIAGVCGTGYSGTCDGVASDQTAITNWRNAVKGSSALAVLYCAPGKTINAQAGDQWMWDGVGSSGNVVQNAVLWAYGCSANWDGFGGESVPLSTGSTVACANSARISTVSAGATSVTIPSGQMVDGSSDAGVFPAGTQVLIAGVSTQQFANFPPNFQFFEYGVSAGQSGNTITLSAPLANTYKSTWPAPGSVCASGVDLGGPATIYKLISFTNYQIYGLTNKLRAGHGQQGITGKSVALYDVTMTAGYPTQTANWFAFFSNFPLFSEVDKVVGNAVWYRSHLDAFGGFSGANHATLYSSTLGRPGPNSMGSLPNLVAINSDLGPNVTLGSNFGNPSSVYLDGTTVPSGAGFNTSPVYELISAYSYSSGVFSYNIPSGAELFSLFAPGFKYQLQYYIGGPGHQTCSPNYGFTVSDLSQSGSTFQATTTSWTSDGTPIATPSTLPTLTGICGGNTANIISSYLAQTITQVNSPAGSHDITSFAAPP